MGALDYLIGFLHGVEDSIPDVVYAKALTIANEFAAYVDSVARANPHVYHHLYEWDQCGDEYARLFEMDITPIKNGARISYHFIESMEPNRNGMVFYDKANTMESGDTVTFYTDEPVPIEIDDQLEFRVGLFTFKPGGNETTGALREAFINYFSSPSMKIYLKKPPGKRNMSSIEQGYRDGMVYIKK